METPQAGVDSEREDQSIYLLGCSVLDRLAYRLLLKHELDREVVVESDFAPTSVWKALRKKPTLALVDADSSSPRAVEAVQMISKLRPSVRVLIVGAGVDPRHIEDWGGCRIHGYVVKDAGVEELRTALDTLADSRQYFSEGVRNAIRRARKSNIDARPGLSRRETELLPLLARGMTLREAAQEMTVSYKTADSFRTSLLRKLGLRDRVELARYAIREHIVDP